VQLICFESCPYPTGLPFSPRQLKEHSCFPQSRGRYTVMRHVKNCIFFFSREGTSTSGSPAETAGIFPGLAFEKKKILHYQYEFKDRKTEKQKN